MPRMISNVANIKPKAAFGLILTLFAVVARLKATLPRLYHILGSV
jgi:hypothetical protein